jgi:hypothetical protein
MQKRVISYAAAVAAGLCAVIAFSTNWALAAGDCWVQSNRQQAQSGHWYYRVDRVNHRKCWYVVESKTRLAQAEAPEARPAPDATLQPMFFSLLSLLSADFTAAKPAGTQLDGTNRDARAVQTRPADLKNGDVSRVKRARTARHDPNTAPAAKSIRQSPTGPHAERTDQPPPLDQAERDVLFQEFLRWNARPTP